MCLFYLVHLCLSLHLTTKPVPWKPSFKHSMTFNYFFYHFFLMVNFSCSMSLKLVKFNRTSTKLVNFFCPDFKVTNRRRLSSPTVSCRLVEVSQNNKKKCNFIIISIKPCCKCLRYCLHAFQVFTWQLIITQNHLSTWLPTEEI